MLVPIKWLKDYVDIDISPKELCDRLTMSGSKVEELIIQGEEIKNVVTGKILQIEKHPNADKLVVCKVDIGEEEPIQIVTAATNMKEQDVVPVALHGSTLYGGVKIKRGKLRGVVSNGMFCSEEELGIADGKYVDGLLILPQNTPIGKDIKEVLDMQKASIDFEITSNRRDCFSIIGIARETAATLGKSYRKPDLTYNASISEDADDMLKVEIKDKLCRRYMAKKIKNVKIQPSPQWMKERLLEAGVRPINNIVDITNFVMLELGQPMHAYDRRDIKSGVIKVDRASEGEKFTTLDGIERKLSKNVLCIKDGEKTIGIAGIMGGLNSEIKNDTKEVIFECANFDGTNIRLSSKELVLRTEASSKFEKDLDPNLCEIALNRACHLVEELGAGDIVKETIDKYNEKVEPHTLIVNANWVNKFLGTNISFEEMKNYLDRLELQTQIEDDNLKIQVPTFRSDINIKEDVAEEIARMYGYNKINSTLPSTRTIRAGKSKKQKLKDKLIEVLISSGLCESISYSFGSPKVFDKIFVPKDSKLRDAVKIRNPLGEDYSIMRTTTIPSMMENLYRNYSRNNDYVRLFEIGKVYLKSDKELPNEINTLTIGMYGKCDFLVLKGVIENILNSFGILEYEVKRKTDNLAFHPGKTAELFVKNDSIGIFGEVHPDVCDNYGIDENCYIAEINLDILFSYANLERKYTPLPKYPAVTRDLAVIVDKNVMVQDIEKIINKNGGNIVESYKLFDVYEGKQIPEGKKSVAYTIVYRLKNKTLTDKDVNKVHNKIVRALEYNIGAMLR